MITSLKLENFQSHKNTELHFHPGVNVIVGSTDSGKTAVIRALKEIIWNRPGGTECISHWAKAMNIQITVETATIRKEKSSSRNAYVVNGKEYVAFGRDVPEDVKKILGMDEINIQMQMDSPFLLSQSSGEIALHFNRIAKIDNIHNTISNIKQKSKKLEQSQQFKLQEIDNLKTKINKLTFLEKLEIQVEVLEQMEGKKEDLENRIKKLKDIVKTYIKIEGELKKLTHVLDLEKRVNFLLSIMSKKEELENHKSGLVRVLKNLNDIEYHLKKKIEVSRLEMPVINILTLYSNIAITKTEKTAFDTLVERLKRNQIQIKQKTRFLQDLEKEFQENFPDVCPLCDSILIKTPK